MLAMPPMPRNLPFWMCPFAQRRVQSTSSARRPADRRRCAARRRPAARRRCAARHRPADRRRAAALFRVEVPEVPVVDGAPALRVAFDSMNFVPASAVTPAAPVVVSAARWMQPVIQGQGDPGSARGYGRRPEGSGQGRLGDYQDAQAGSAIASRGYRVSVRVRRADLPAG
jgi:hypothetical protein